MPGAGERHSTRDKGHEEGMPPLSSSSSTLQVLSQLRGQLTRVTLILAWPDVEVSFEDNLCCSQKLLFGLDGLICHLYPIAMT